MFGQSKAIFIKKQAGLVKTLYSVPNLQAQTHFHPI
jgi:hypothetical protein